MESVTGVTLPLSGHCEGVRMPTPLTDKPSPAENPLEILLVEDNPGDVILLEKLFEGSRCRVRLNIVGDGEEALGYLHQRGPYHDAPRPELILLDLNLPRKNGHEVLQEIRGSATLNSIPTVVLTSSAQDADWRRAHDAGVNAYLRKPRDWSRYPSFLKYLEDYWLWDIQKGKHLIKSQGGGGTK